MNFTEQGKKLNLFHIYCLGLGGTIGSGIFVMMGSAIAYTGKSIVVAVSVGCLYMLLAYLYQPVMASMFVVPGGDYDMKAMLFGPVLTGVSAVTLALNCFGVASYGLAMGSYLSAVFPSLIEYRVWVAAVTVTFFFLAAIKGSRFLANLAAVISVALILAIAIFVGTGLPQVQPGFFSDAGSPFYTGGFVGFFMAMSYMSFACQGTTTAPISVMPVTKRARRTIPAGILLTTLSVAVIYGLMSVVASGVLPVEQVANQNLSLVAETIFSRPMFLFFILGAACCAIASSLASGMTMMRYPMLQIAADGWLPKPFKKVTKDGYPYVTMLFFYGCCLLCTFSGFDIDTLISMLMIPTMLMNVFLNFSLLKLVAKYPEQWKNSFLHMPRGLFRVLTVLSGVCALLVSVSLFVVLSGKERIICLGIVIFCFVYAYLRVKTGAVDRQELLRKREEIARRAIEATAEEE